MKNPKKAKSSFFKMIKDKKKHLSMFNSFNQFTVFETLKYSNISSPKQNYKPSREMSTNASTHIQGVKTKVITSIQARKRSQFSSSCKSIFKPFSLEKNHKVQLTPLPKKLIDSLKPFYPDDNKIRVIVAKRRIQYTHNIDGNKKHCLNWIVFIQRKWREHFLMKQHKAACRIQKVYTGYIVRKCFNYNNALNKKVKIFVSRINMMLAMRLKKKLIAQIKRTKQKKKITPNQTENAQINLIKRTNQLIQALNKLFNLRLKATIIRLKKHRKLQFKKEIEIEINYSRSSQLKNHFLRGCNIITPAVGNITEVINLSGINTFPRIIVNEQSKKYLKHKISNQDIHKSSSIEVEILSQQPTSKPPIQVNHQTKIKLIPQKVCYTFWNMFTKEQVYISSRPSPKTIEVSKPFVHFKEAVCHSKTASSSFHKSLLDLSPNNKTNQTLLFKAKLFALLMINIFTFQTIKGAFVRIKDETREMNESIEASIITYDSNTIDNEMTISCDIGNEMDSCDYRKRNDINPTKGHNQILF